MLVLGEIIRRNADVVPTKAACVFRSQGSRVVVTYAELNDRANRFANALRAYGGRSGDRIAFLSRNNAEMAVAMWGVVKAGMLAMPLNFRYTSTELAPLLAQGMPRVIVTEERYLPALTDPLCRDLLAKATILRFGSGPVDGTHRRFSDLLLDSDANEPAVSISETDPHVLLCTSGTTGPAKGVLQSHRAYYLQTGNPVLSAHGTAEVDVGLCPYQLFHSSGWRTSLIYWRARATVVILDRPTPDEVVDAIECERVTQLVALPQTLLDLCRSDLTTRDLSSVTAVNTGTSSIDPDDGRLIRETFPSAEYRVHYGASEVGPVASAATSDTVTRPLSVGRPTLHVDVRIEGPDGARLGVGIQGEVVVRSDFLMLGYRNAPELTDQVVVDGWYHTGDLGYLDDDAYLFVTGRVSDVIRSAGESVYPSEVERCLLGHPAVEQCAVVGIPDPQWGESVGAVVVLGARHADGPSVEELQMYARDRLAGYKVPKEVVFTATLPRVEATGKVAKVELAGILRRARERAGETED